MINLNDFRGSSQIVITPDVARYLLDNHNYKYQRPVRQWHVDVLASEMNKGLFIRGTEIHFARLGDKIVCVDGQHTLAAVAKTNPILLTIITHDVKSEEEIASIYSVLDRQLKRTYSDSYRAFGLEETTGLNKTQLNLVGAALRQIYSGFPNGGGTSRNHTPHMVKQWMEEWSSYAKIYFGYIEGGSSDVIDLMRKASILGVALITTKYQEVKSEKFWHQIAYDDGLNNGDPRKTLGRWILRNPAFGGDVTSKRVTQREYALYVSTAWKAYMEDRELKVLKVNDKKAQLTIHGTPYDSGVNGYGI